MSTTLTVGSPLPVNKFAALTALLAVAVGCVVLTGWAFDVAVLKSISPDWVSMKANSAVCFILTGIALLLTVRLGANPQRSPYFLRLARWSCLLVGLLSALTLCEYIFTWNPGIDQWLFVEPVGAVGTSSPGRMAPETALCFILLATALWITYSARKTRFTVLTSVSCSLLVLTLALAAMQSYVTPSLGPYGWFGLTIMAMHTAILFLLLGTSVIALSWQQDEWPWSFSKRTSAAFACSLILLVFIGLNANRSQFQLKEINRQIIYKEKVVHDIENLLIEVIDTHTRTRGYIITGDERFKTRYLASKVSNIAKLDALRNFVADNPLQQQQFSRIEARVKDELEWLQLAIDSERHSNTPAARNKMVVHGEELLESLRHTADQIAIENQQHIRQLRQQEKDVTRRSFFYVTTGTLASLLTLLIVIFRLNFAVNERKQNEQVLKESEQRYRFLFENMLEGYAFCKMLFDQDTPQDFIYLNVNDAFEKITGLKNVEGKKVTEAIPGIRASNPKLFEIYGRVALTGQPEKFETYVEGLGIWFSITAYSPHREYFVAVFNDITERKQTEEALSQREAELRTLVEYSPIAMLVDVGIDADEKIIMMNRKFTKLFGYTLTEVPNVTHWWPLAYPDEKYREELIADWQVKTENAIQSHSLIEPMEVMVTCKDGSNRHVRISTSSIGNRNIITFEDFTERKLAESKLNEQLDELRRWQEATLGREARILELKREVNGMLLKAGLPPRYPSAEASTE